MATPTTRRIQTIEIPLKGDPQPFHYNVVIKNESASPIHDVQVWFGAQFLAEQVWLQKPGSDRLVVPTARPIRRLDPIESTGFLSPELHENELITSHPHIYFTDDVGQHWQADEDGGLRKIEKRNDLEPK